MTTDGKASCINLLDVSTVPMRTFHLTWLTFFLCFIAWFAIAPLLPIIRGDLKLSNSEVVWSMIGGVAISIVARLVIGWLCDRIGPRLTYTWLLILGSLPVIGAALAQDFLSLLIFRILISIIGASFVITQYHTSQMFAANCVGLANATTAGWGNLGGGVTQILMPALFWLFTIGLGCGESLGWRLALVVPGLLCILAGFAYLRWTQDTPQGNLGDLRGSSLPPDKCSKGWTQSLGSFWSVCADYRVWALFVLYGCCFGIEVTIHSMAALYFVDYFGLDVYWAGMAAAVFGLMNIFARSLGGWVSDQMAKFWGLPGRVNWLFVAVLGEGLTFILFAYTGSLLLAMPMLMFFGLFVKMSNGAAYAVVPFINRQALGSVAGIVGAGGNVGAVLSLLLFQGYLGHWPDAMLSLGLIITACSFLALTIRFTPEITSVPPLASVTEPELAPTQS